MAISIPCDRPPQGLCGGSCRFTYTAQQPHLPLSSSSPSCHEMTFANIDVDPDPTTQIAWPASNGKRIRVTEPTIDESALGEASNGSNQPGAKNDKDDDSTQRRMSTWDLVKLSISMAGAQIAWTVELGSVGDVALSLGACDPWKYSYNLQIWHPLLALSRLIRGAHQPRLACWPYQRARRPACNRCVLPSACCMSKLTPSRIQVPYRMRRHPNIDVVTGLYSPPPLWWLLL